MRRKKLGPPSWSAQEGFRRLFKKSKKIEPKESEKIPSMQQDQSAGVPTNRLKKHELKKLECSEEEARSKKENAKSTIPLIDQLKTRTKRRSPLETKRAAKSARINFDSILGKSQCHDENDNLSRLDEFDKANQNRAKSDKLVTPAISYSNFQDDLSNLFIQSGSEELILSDILTKLNVELDAVEGHFKTLEAQNRIMIAVDDGTKKVFLI